MGQVEPRLCVDRGLAIEQEAGPGVQRIAGERLAQKPFCLGMALELAKDDGLQVASSQALGVQPQHGVKTFQGLVPIFLAAIHFCQGQIGRSRHGLVPGGLGEGRVGRGNQRLLLIELVSR